MAEWSQSLQGLLLLMAKGCNVNAALTRRLSYLEQKTDAEIRFQCEAELIKEGHYQ